MAYPAYQQRRLERGECIACGDPHLVTKCHCQKHADKIRARARNWYQHNKDRHNANTRLRQIARAALIAAERPFCVRCRSKMKKAGRENGRRYFKCGRCGARALNESKRRPSAPVEHVASCAACRRALVTGGNSRQYLRCLNCKMLVARTGQSRTYARWQHLASCVTCKGSMTGQSCKGALIAFYCTRCKIGARREYKRGAPVLDRQLFPFIESLVPKDVPPEVRQEACSDILLALLKTRRAKNGHGLMPAQLTREKVRSFVQLARRRLDYRFRQISIDEGEFPLTERLVG